MWSALGNLVLPHITKYLTPILGVGCLLLGLYAWYQHNAYEDMHEAYNKEKLAKELLETQYALEQEKFKSTIAKQNIRIEQYELDLKQFETTVSIKEKELAETRYQLQEQVNQELAKDSSSDNQLTIVNRILYDFSKGN